MWCSAWWRRAGHALLACIVLGASVAQAQQPPAIGSKVPPTADEVRKALEARRIELQTTETKARTIEKDVAELNLEREKLNARLLETAAEIQKSEAKLTKIEGRIGELEAQEKLVRGSLSQRQGQIAQLLAALQRMGRNPPPVMITRREDALGMVRSAMLLSAAFPGMRTQALALAQTLDNLETVMTSIRQENEKERAENARLNDMRTRLAGLLEERRQSVTAKQDELQKVRQEAAEISKSAADLGELITRLDEAVTRNTAGLQAYQEEAKHQVAAAEAGATPSSSASPAGPGANETAPPTTSPASKPAAATGPEVAALSPQAELAKPAVVELAPSRLSLMPGSAGRIKPAIPFQLAKAKLPLPVQGRRVISFGEKTQYGSTSKGIVLETRANAQVVSPCDGWVVYAREFRSYGQLLIINAGGGYHVLVAGMSQIDVQPGQFILAAEPVGTMSAVPKAEQDGSQTTAPVLYVEFHKDGQPIDPDPWWVESLEKVQG